MPKWIAVNGNGAREVFDTRRDLVDNLRVRYADERRRVLIRDGPGVYAYHAPHRRGSRARESWMIYTEAGMARWRRELHPKLF